MSTPSQPSSMYGLQNKKPKQPPILFDLEVELKSPKKRKELIEKVDERMGQIRNHLRAGEEKETFGNLVVILNGYLALLKVLNRFNQKK